MNGIKKVKVAFVALLSTCLSCGLISTSSENDLTTQVVSFASSSYSSQDINRDGDINIFDTMKLNRVLLGTDYIANNGVLDADGNSIVSTADSYCAMSGAVENVFTNRVRGTSKVFSSYTTTLMPTTNQSVSQWFSCHNYTSNTNSSYMLSLQETSTNSSAMNMPGILGPDSREADALEGVVYLSSRGTGFIVGDHVIATAAHCVYDRNKSQWVSDLCVYLPDADGKATTVPLNAVEAHIPTNFKTNANDMYDYALITVSEDLSEYYHFNLGMPYNVYTNSDFANYTIYSTGYSQYIPDGETEDELNSYPTPQMYTGEGQIVNGSNVDHNLVCFDTDITYGNSGGPVYVKETYKSGNGESIESLTVISICSGIWNVSEPHRNMGPTMNAIMLKFYRSNSNISY